MRSTKILKACHHPVLRPLWDDAGPTSNRGSGVVVGGSAYGMTPAQANRGPLRTTR